LVCGETPASELPLRSEQEVAVATEIEAAFDGLVAAAKSLDVDR
jgi:hypothetical protein